MGREFCKHKVEVFDAVIIVSSFIVDLVFLGGMPGEEGEKAAAVLVVLLLWRIARVVDGKFQLYLICNKFNINIIYFIKRNCQT